MSHHSRLAPGLLLLAGGVALAQADPPKGPPKDAKASPEEIGRLIGQLGDKNFAKRTQAKKDLEAIGEPAIAPLKRAAESATDEEVRSTAEALAEALERKHSGLVRAFEGHADRVNGVAVSPDGKRAVSTSWDRLVRYWDLEKGELIRMLKGHENPVMSAALSPDGKRALTGSSDRTMRLWDLATGDEVRKFVGHTHTVWDVVFSPDGTRALSGCSDGLARLWDVESGKELLSLAAQEGGRAWTVAFTPDGTRAVTGGGTLFERRGAPEGSLRLWDLKTGREVRRFDGHGKDVRRVAVSPDGKRLLSASFDGTMRLWELETGQEVRRFDGPGHFVEAVAFTPDGKRAVCSYGPRIVEAVYTDDPRCSLRLWDLASGKELKQFRGHTGPVLSLALSGDGRLLVSGSADKTMRVWEMPK